MSMLASSAVRKANKASSPQLFASFGPEVSASIYDFRIFHATDLHDSKHTQAIWDIFEDNMRDFYRSSSFGWDPAEKLKELFDPLSRFVLVYADHGEKLVAFTMFRFEYEYYENIIYCYELQILKSYQRNKLGKTLLRVMENIGRAWNMEKVVLTVLKVNTCAMQFYQALGFVVDASSPSYSEIGEDERSDDGADYEILSKAFHPTHHLATKAS